MYLGRTSSILSNFFSLGVSMFCLLFMWRRYHAVKMNFLKDVMLNMKVLLSINHWSENILSWKCLSHRSFCPKHLILFSFTFPGVSLELYIRLFNRPIHRWLVLDGMPSPLFDWFLNQYHLLFRPFFDLHGNQSIIESHQ